MSHTIPMMLLNITNSNLNNGATVRGYPYWFIIPANRAGAKAQHIFLNWQNLESSGLRGYRFQ
jgi:hypothetical protein